MTNNDQESFVKKYPLTPEEAFQDTFKNPVVLPNPTQEIWDIKQTIRELRQKLTQLEDRVSDLEDQLLKL